MVDLDAPTPQMPTVAQIRHFLGGNFKLERRISEDRVGVALLTNSTPALTEFHQPTPPAGSDPHRYVLTFLLPSEKNLELTLIKQSPRCSKLKHFFASLFFVLTCSYTFLLFVQPPGFNRQTEVNASTSIASFNISQFALDVGLGSPIGGTFMLVGPDPS